MAAGVSRGGSHNLCLSLRIIPVLETPKRRVAASKFEGIPVPGPIIDLLPPELTKPSGAAANTPAVPVPASALPDFATPKHVVSDGFLSNLKQFLTERPLKVNGSVNSTLMPPAYGDGFSENLKEFFSSRPVPRGPVNSRLAVSWGTSFGGFGYRVKEFFSPTKLPPLQVTSKPIKVKDIWSKDENFGWTQVLSIGLHIGIMALLILPFIFKLSTDVQAKGPLVDVTPLDISDYVSKLPAGDKKAGGGGGGGDREVLPASKGRAPKFKMTQFTPPEAHPNPAPKLPMDASLLGPPDLRVSNPNLPNLGDPLANAPNLSGGSGGGGGFGTGENGGIGSGNGGGLGPGSGGGTGGGEFRAGVNGVGQPQCIYCPSPEFSDEARKAKYQGTVLLDVIITADGRVIEPTVIKGVGLGLDEKAIEGVRKWKMRPAPGPNGKPVACRTTIEVVFHLY
jgi:periplasmic protein TonB